MDLLKPHERQFVVRNRQALAHHSLSGIWEQAVLVASTKPDPNYGSTGAAVRNSRVLKRRRSDSGTTRLKFLATWNLL